jgi:predicted amidohydrolase
MKICCIQMNVKLRQVEENFANAEVWLRKAAAAGADTAVLPEVWNGGFLTVGTDERIADEDGKRSRAFLSALAKELNMNIVGGSVATKKQGEFFNTCYVADRQGTIIAEYDKAHLFSFAGEDKRFSPGNQLVTFCLDGVTCGVIICYEVRFPEWCRKQALAGAKILFVPAQWPLLRVNHWRIMNQARAIENQMFVVAVNGCGEVEPLKYNAGNSLIIDPLGNLLADAGKEPEEKMIMVELELSQLEETRKAMTIFSDRRVDLY